MKGTVVESKFKFMQGILINFNQYTWLTKTFTKHNIRIGEALKDKFEGIMPSDAASDSHFVRSNGVFTAVSQYPYCV